MAQIYTFKLQRIDQSTPWGFRLQGGKDFGTPLLIQKVNAGSIAEKVGLRVGDAIIRVNNTDVSEQRHKDAQETIIKAGNYFELGVQRGGFNTWKPAVTPVGTVPKPNPNDSVSPITVTRTSLSAANQTAPRAPSGFNSRMKAFSPCNGAEHENTSAARALASKQYNSPVSMYSDESIAETLSAQAEVLSGGVLGVNFKKNEKSFDTESSEVFKMLVEAENEPKTPQESDIDRIGLNSPTVAGLRHVSAPQTKTSPSESSVSTPSKNICAECERLIVGVFVRIRDKNLHVECFKCATCGTSLKNVGYYNINEKLYCDIHAKMIAKQNGANYGGNAAGTTQTGNTILSNSSSQFAGTIPSPLSSPFKPQQTNTSNVSFQNNVSTNLNGMKSPSFNHQYQPASSQQQQQRPGILKTKTGTTPLFDNQSQQKGGIGNRIGGGGSRPIADAPNSAPRTSAGLSTPRRGKGVWNPQNLSPEARIPLCAGCNSQIRGPFVTALGKIWCPEHFVCTRVNCGRSLLEIGFVEEPSGFYCEYCFEQYLAPTCAQCSNKIKGDCLNAIGKHFHPDCFTCAFCNKYFGNSPFFLEDGLPYCERDWNELFTTKCFACGFPIEAGDRWVEALGNNYHSPCFNCTMCKMNLEGQSFYAKGGRPFCKNHSR